MNLRMVGGMFLYCSLYVSLFMLTVSNVLLMSSATVTMRCGGLFWLKPVATMVLFMLCSAVRVEWLLLKSCSVAMLFLMYGSSVFFMTERRKMGLYDVHVFGFGNGMMFASFHV